MTLSLLKARSTYVWLALVIVTLVSWAVGAEHEIGSGESPFVLGLAAIKIWFVGLNFMELRSAP